MDLNERKIDELGRVTVPPEVLRYLGWQVNDYISMSVSFDSITFKRSIKTCVFCNSISRIVTIKNARVCRNCINRLHEAKDGAVIYVVR